MIHNALLKKITLFVVAFASLGLGRTVNAKMITIDDHACLDSNLSSIHQLFTQYSRYADLPGSEYSMMGISAMRITKSQSVEVTSTPTLHHANVWLVLQPLNLTQSKLYPRFLLDCKTEWSSTQSFNQICTLQKDKQHYGLYELTILVTALKSDRLCASNQAGVKINITLSPDPDHLAQIKRAALEPAGETLAAWIEQFFDEETFFKGFFESVYSGWLQTL
jgi:hypothetical protein